MDSSRLRTVRFEIGATRTCTSGVVTTANSRLTMPRLTCDKTLNVRPARNCLSPRKLSLAGRLIFYPVRRMSHSPPGPESTTCQRSIFTPAFRHFLHSVMLTISPRGLHTVPFSKSPLEDRDLLRIDRHFEHCQRDEIAFELLLRSILYMRP